MGTKTLTFLNPYAISNLLKGVFMTLCLIGQEKSETNLKLLEEAKKKFFSVFFVPIDGIRIGMEEKFAISYRTSDLTKFDSIYPRVPNSFYSFAYQLLSLFPPEIYTPVKPISFLLADERFFLLSVLRKRGINTLDIQLARSPKAAYGILEEREFPIIIRIPGKETGVVANTLSEAKSVIDALGSLKQSILIEEFVKDVVSCYVAEPDVIASVKKKTKEKDVVFSRGDYKNHKPDVETKHLALEASKAIDTQLARVDVSINGDPKVVNISLSPDLMTPSKATGISLPREIIRQIYENYRRHKEKPMLMKFFEDAKSVVKDVFKDKHLM
jgi:glutathione synthase/RimK-type ligase-like ATP-grasp enzyme